MKANRKGALSNEAALLLDELLCVYARTIAHEASNLIFLEEIAARTGKKDGAETQAALAFIRRQARVVSHALTPVPRPRLVRLGDVAGDVSETLGRQTSLKPLLEWSIDPAAATVEIRETPGRTQLLVQHLIETAVRQMTSGVGAAVSVRWTETAVTLRALQGQGMPEPSALARELAALDGHDLEVQADGAVGVGLRREQS